MDQARFDEAMGNISQALKRAEKASEALITRTRAPGAGGDEQLRARVSSVLGELDALIESLPQ